jgi:hypothetical protein
VTSFAAQLPTLVGVVVGAGASFFATFANERTRWQREREAKWDENRAVAYMEYGYAVKKIIDISRRIAAGSGMPEYLPPLDLEAGLIEPAADADRGMKWEAVLLMGSANTIEAARQWHSCAWRLEHHVRGSTQVEWQQELRQAATARSAFYQSARQDLGVHGTLPAEGEINLPGTPEGNTA